jgi:hypothetical protein
VAASGSEKNKPGITQHRSYLLFWRRTVANLTIDQITDLRNDLGDNKTPPAFSDAELQRLYTRSDDNYSKTMVLGLDQLIMDAAKFSDYTQNETQEKKSQIFDHLLKVRAIWQGRVKDETLAATKTVRMTKLRPVWRSKGTPNA